jgi:hypothetical protein
MPLYTGATRDQRPDDRPYLSVLVLGTASDGTIGETRWFSDADQSAFAYGGGTVARFNPCPTDTSATLPLSFVPDDRTLSLDPRVLLYQFNATTGQPIRYDGLGARTASGAAVTYSSGSPVSSGAPAASGTPVTLMFDPIGYDTSVVVNPGGLVIEAPGYARHGLNGDLLLPLMSALTELGSSDTLLNVGGCRVGASWLPDAPPEVTTFGPLTLSCAGQGDGSSWDPYLSVTVLFNTDSVVIDPGVLGLPYRRRVYPFMSYATWNLLWDAIQLDYLAGLIPLRIALRPVRGDMTASAAPVIGIPVTYHVSYEDTPITAPDLTTAAGWLVVLAENDLPMDECPFLVFSGLTAQALAEDPVSTTALLNIIDQNADGSDENPTLTLILPWSLTPPPAGIAYDGSADADAMFNLLDAIGPQLASHLLVFWGGMTQTSMPVGLDGNPIPIPVAYAAAGALVRESSSVDATSNVLHPQILTVSTTYVPPLLIQTASEAPSPAVPTSVPSPTALENLRVSGMSALTRSVGDRWCMDSPILLGNGDEFRISLCESVMRERVQRLLDQYLGESNTQDTWTNITTTLDTLVADVSTAEDAVSRQIAAFSLQLLSSAAQDTQLIAALSVQGQMTLYGETSVINFQVSLTG